MSEVNGKTFKKLELLAAPARKARGWLTVGQNMATQS